LLVWFIIFIYGLVLEDWEIFIFKDLTLCFDYRPRNICRIINLDSESIYFPEYIL